MTNAPATTKRTPVPRGIARSGPAIFSYGFRPFFLAAGVWAVAAMGLWIAALAGSVQVGGSYGAPAWHAHEMLFGYSSAALAGFLLTAVPNWTGRLPVSGGPLVALLLVWLAGRLVLLFPDALGLGLSIAVDASFLPVLLGTCAREIVAGKKWKDLKVLAALTGLAAANIGFHVLALRGGDLALANRLAIGAYVMLIGIIGGRVVPSFTRNWLAKRHVSALPAAYDRFDVAALLTGLSALSLWVALPGTVPTALACLAASVVHLMRLLRWRGWQTGAEALVLVLHIGYAFVPIGFLAVGAAQAGWLEPVAALHLFTVGGIGMMTLAIMSRATRGHTGLVLKASRLTALSYILILIAAIARPATALLPHLMMELLSLSGVCWMAGFGLYVFEYAPTLMRKRRDRLSER